MKDMTLRVGSFNMRGASIGDPPPNDWATRAPVFASHMIQSGVAIAAWQEGSSQGGGTLSQSYQAVELMNGLTSPGRWKRTFFTTAPSTIVWDSTVLSQEGTPTLVPANIEHTIGNARWVLYCKFKHLESEQVFWFVATHWQHDDPDATNGRIRRQESAEIVTALMTSLRLESGLPVILGGDFNTSSLETNSPRGYMVERGFRNMTPPGSSENGRYNSYNGFDVTMTNRVKSEWIDGIHASGDITRVSSGQILRFSTGSSLPLSSPLPSDHNLVWADVSRVLVVSSSGTPGEGPTPWPPRNLGRGDYWGRTVERRVDNINRATGIRGEGLQGYNRYSVSTADELSKNARAISELAQDVEDAILATPQYFVRSVEATGFGFGGSTWKTVASSTITPPAGFTSAEISATAVAVSFQSGTIVDDFMWPFDPRPQSQGGDVSSEFGPRPPLRYHRGIDFALPGAPYGKAIPAAHNGTVILRGYYDDWGNYTRISCSDLTGVANSWTGYAHMSAFPLHPVGSTITKGQTLGYVGQTGYVTGPHLHWETALENERINPREFMSIFESSGSASFVPVQARIVIDGVASPTFQPYTEMGLSANQINYPIFGRSLAVNQPVTVQLQVRSPGGNVPASPPQRASLVIRGGFKQ